MFFWHYRFYALGLLPVRGRFSRLWRYLRVVLGYYDGKDKLVAWHQAELEKLDPMSKLQQDGLRLVAAQEKAEAEGVSPTDPKYPSFSDYREHERIATSRTEGSVSRLLEISRRYKPPKVVP